MTAVLPNGYLTLLQAAEVLAGTMYAGAPDLPVVRELRKRGVPVRDGQATAQAVIQLWKAVDAGTLRAMAIGGRPRRVVRLDSQLTRSVPLLRNPRGRGFTFLRHSNPAYDQLASWFGSGVHEAAVAFREMEVQKLARRLMRARRSARRVDGQNKVSGRPALVPLVQAQISHIVDRQKWDITMGIKALTREINRHGKWQRRVSQDTVSRALDLQYEQTNDRRFERVRYRRRPRSHRTST
jgi:hypothetical protein